MKHMKTTITLVLFLGLGLNPASAFPVACCGVSERKIINKSRGS